ncbi:MAG: LysM domain [Gaiellales bacterium]|nr:LysM domain [Gaiellales bacterium]
MEQGERTMADRLDPTSDHVATPFLPADEPGLADVRELCPFLASESADGRALGAIGRPDPANRCIALGEPQPQSVRQQELVCLTASHINCPRYLRGVLLAGAPPPKAARQPISVAVIGSGLVLAAALAASFAFLVVRGGFDLPIGTPGPSELAVATTASPAATTSPAPTLAPSTSPSPTPSPSPSPSAAPSPSATVAPTATPAATARPTARPTPAPTSDRYALLTRCPGTPDCWIYTIRSGDNLQSIANWFGVSYDRVRAMNPGLAVPIHAGERLRIPTPTR